jgi:hypothetical protein
MAHNLKPYKFYEKSKFWGYAPFFLEFLGQKLVNFTVAIRAGLSRFIVRNLGKLEI